MSLRAELHKSDPEGSDNRLHLRQGKVVIYGWVVSESNRTSDLRFTVDDSRGNVGQTGVIEVLLNILPEAVAKGAKAKAPAEKFAIIGEKKIVTATRPNEEGLFTDLAVVAKDSASIVANVSAIENDPGPANDNSASL